jgi:hypothetical protein
VSDDISLFRFRLGCLTLEQRFRFFDEAIPAVYASSIGEEFRDMVATGNINDELTGKARDLVLPILNRHVSEAKGYSDLTLEEEHQAQTLIQKLHKEWDKEKYQRDRFSDAMRAVSDEPNNLELVAAAMVHMRRWKSHLKRKVKK